MSPDRRRRAGGRDGFTLVEVLVAFAVLGVFMVALQRGLVVSRTGSMATVGTTQAQQVARTLLESPVPRELENPGRMTGRLGGHDWTMVTEAIPLPLPEPPTKDGDSKRPDGRQGAAQADRGPGGSNDGEQNESEEEDKPEQLWRPLRLTISVRADPRRMLTVETVRLVRMQQERTE